MWKLALRRPRRQEERWEWMRKRHQRTKGQKKHPRKRGERLGFPARRMDRRYRVLWVISKIFARKGRRTAKEATIRSTSWTISGSISMETCWWTTTTHSSCALVPGRSIYAVRMVAWAFESMEFPVE